MSMILDILRSTRPRQWTKSLIVFAPAIFAGRILQTSVAGRVTAAFLLMCVLSGAVYVLNDVMDRRSDRLHPVKRLRPVAAGTLGRTPALLFAAGATAFALGAGYLLSPALAVAFVAYLALQIAYSAYLKRVVVLDVLCIAAGFLLRAVAGAAVVPVPNSPWLLACAGFLVLFLALAKRRHEMIELGVEAAEHRSTLGRYTLPTVDVMVAASVVATLAGYLTYALLGAREGARMALTVPFVAYGLFRYLFLMYAKDRREMAEDVLLTDAPLIAAIMLWLASVMVVVYAA